MVKVIAAFRKSLEKRGIRNCHIILFGSRAKGEEREESDIDLIVLSDDFQGKDYWERVEILAAAIYEVFEPIEAIAMTFEEWEKGSSPLISFARTGQVL
jgi:predicted nucleotidyltransferase